jgi:hypothetical protein
MNTNKLIQCCLVGVTVALSLVVAGRTARADLAIQARLDGASPVSQTIRPGCYYFVYRFHMTAEEPVVFDLSSRDFDAYLVLFDPQGRVVAQDDDSGGGTNARLTFTAPEDGWYEVMVTTARPGMMGNYIVNFGGEDDQ